MNTQNAGEKSRNSIPNVLACAEKNDFQKRPKITTFIIKETYPPKTRPIKMSLSNLCPQSSTIFQNMPSLNKPSTKCPSNMYSSKMQRKGKNVTAQTAPRTWCQILCTMRLQCVSKILTPRWMLQNTLLIAKINLWTNSFQNMYDMLQVRVARFARKTFFSKKNAEKQPFLAARNPGSPDFGRSCMPNYWDQVNFWGTPEKFGV